ncbi:hypothetical protein HYPSUDRAFT_81720 [Hypholoma sublateritium FD-334 SS-4]|uniref:HIG1 domain-containing protein n=1 Tax=Hypholoma sublateritium (strain FD-334 SS-4) TaxID=945553 RepID=A0A0D2LPQ3_HYPSF|nr:hypothetical protein HYPSUDRAFT_81720 [Hypholoma sublateritium FD-334 SS-4]
MSRRSQQKEAAEEAYQLQTRAGIEGAARTTAIGLGLAVIGHHLWPAFRRQTVAIKGFLVSGFTIFGLVFGAERALVEFENKKRREENALRQEARIALARRGLIGTETEIAQWRTEQASERTNKTES